MLVRKLSGIVAASVRKQLFVAFGEKIDSVWTLDDLLFELIQHNLFVALLLKCLKSANSIIQTLDFNTVTDILILRQKTLQEKGRSEKKETYVVPR